MISIEGLDEAEVLAALYNAARDTCRSDRLGPMPVDAAKYILSFQRSFPEIDGRVLNVNFGIPGSPIDETLYEEANGTGLMGQVIDGLRGAKKSKSTLDRLIQVLCTTGPELMHTHPTLVQPTRRAEPKQPSPKTTTTEPDKKEPDMSVIIDVNDKTKHTPGADIAVERAGSKVSVPEGVPLKDAIAALQRQEAEDSLVVSVSHKFKMTAAEGGRLFMKALKDLHGFVSPAKGTAMIGIATGAHTTEMLPWGKMEVPGIDGFLAPNLYPMNGLFYFEFGGAVKGSSKAAVQRIADHMNAIASEQSLYRGQALRVSFPETYDSIEDILPKFIDIGSADEKALIFGKDIQDLVGVTLFTPIEATAECRAQKIPLKRGVLLEGPYGVGKTLTATVTAKKCVENGWTFILLEDVSQLSRALEFARQYQPSVVFAEDIDQVLKDEDERDENINAILNQIDGIESKASEVITILTTNNVSNITQAMLRPGRLDTVIPVRAPDAEAAIRLVRHFAGDRISESEDLMSVGEQLAGMIPAVIREVVERSKLGAIHRARHVGGNPKQIIAGDISIAAHSMAAHLALLTPHEEDKRSPIECAADRLGDKLIQALTQRTGVQANGHSSLHSPVAAAPRALG